MSTSRRRLLAVYALLGCLALGAGVSPAGADIDLSGPWAVVLNAPGLPPDYFCQFSVSQTGPALSLSSSCLLIGPISLSGTIDPTSGAFNASGAANPLFCGTLDVSGTAAPAGDGFSGTFSCSSAIAGSFAAGLCGNGIVDPGEDCDNGSILSGDDCCSPTCTYDPAGAACPDDGDPCTYNVCDGSGICTHPQAPAGIRCLEDGNQCTDDVCDAAGACTHVNNTSPCDDDNFCTIGETCSGGVCGGGTPLPDGTACSADFNACTLDTCDGSGTCVAGPCSPCCDAAAGCVPALDPQCRAPVAPSAKIRLRRKTGSEGLLWKWNLGEQTDAAAFGDPTHDGGTSYTLCVYAQGPDGLSFEYSATAPAGGLCAGSSCWKQSGMRGFAYADAERTPDGIRLIKLRAGASGRAKVLVKGDGANLKIPPLFLDPPVTVELRASNGECWGAQYQTAVKSGTGEFKASGGQ